MKWMNKKLILIGLVTIICGLGFNVSLGDFEDLGVGARPIGMGNAFVGLADDVNTIYYNPAGLGQLKRKEFTCGYGKLYWGLSGPGETNLGSGFVGYGYPLSWGTLGIGWSNLSLTKYYQENTFIFSCGRQISPPWYMGMNLKILSKRYGKDAYTRANPIFIAHGYTAGAFSMDLGVLCNLTSKLSLGLALMDVNQPNVELAYKGSRVPLSVKIGSAYKNRTLNLALDTAFKDRDVNVYAGAEKWFFSKKLGIRGGIGIGSREYRSLSLGTSFNVSVFEFDYAFIYPLSGIKQIHGSHRLSLTIRQAVPKRPIEVRVKREEIEVEEKGIPSRRLIIRESLLFISGSARISSEAFPVLEEVIKILQQEPEVEITIEGHTDNLPVGRESLYPSNLALSEARANEVFRYLMERSGISGECFLVNGYGDSKPVVSNETAEERAKNRRVEIVVTTIE